MWHNWLIWRSHCWSSDRSVISVIGTAVGGFVGGLLGSFEAGKVSNVVLNNFIEDNANEMVRIIEKEVENSIDSLNELLNVITLKAFSASPGRYAYTDFY